MSVAVAFGLCLCGVVMAGYGSCPISDDCPRNNNHCYKKPNSGCKGKWCQAEGVKLPCSYFSGRRTADMLKIHSKSTNSASSGESDSLAWTALEMQDAMGYNRRAPKCVAFRRRNSGKHCGNHKDFCGITDTQINTLAGSKEGEGPTSVCYRRHCGTSNPAWKANNDYRNSHKCINKRMYDIMQMCNKEPGQIKTARQTDFTDRMNKCAATHGVTIFEDLCMGTDPLSKMKACKETVTNDMMAARQPCNKDCVHPCCNKDLTSGQGTGQGAGHAGQATNSGNATGQGSSNKEDSNSGTMIGIIIGVVACVLVIMITVGVGCYCYKKKQATPEPAQNTAAGADPKSGISGLVPHKQPYPPSKVDQTPSFVSPTKHDVKSKMAIFEKTSA